ncbi:flagellar biosynthesis anti-sigma factor FlgM [Dyella tabacisoli]|uniref:Negative regulator of flagellin synthesis n=1 Tax=Dyella tabacisoli TaxID=2282381 RepID=A0A369UPG1_9GAMM|nr:flagellar biosynthesis anti-sigma factor FlgM [Dyella tabacisoli]RDD82634.1 flagellar biosynthesis anti-sigma factor FlgM [Dyella tabacisoli]
MNTTITSNGLPVLPQAKSGQHGTATQGSVNANATEATPVAAADDSVKLTASARALHQAVQGDKGNAIDTHRVEQVRKALADGSYRIDATRIADRMISLENQLNGKA